MDLYTRTSYTLAEQLTKAYSTSFSLSMSLFSNELRPHIYAIYGMVRIADEIVDTYAGSDQRKQLDALESEVKAAMKRGYSSSPIVHAFARTAMRYRIPSAHVTAFYKSMRMDLTPRTYDASSYKTYIYGSAEVVGLMCLKVFLDDESEYTRLEAGAKRLGAAYQKVNFLRDLKADHEDLGRWYFPKGSFNRFNEAQKKSIIREIRADFAVAKTAAAQLPVSSRKAVTLSIRYYEALLLKLERSSAERILQRRVRITNVRKLILLLSIKLGRS
jgi:phytoene synthase